ncbi:MAG: hypothetical protein RL072_670 [Actinomycetota bacterium]
MVGFAPVDGGEQALADPKGFFAAESRSDIGELLVQVSANGLDYFSGKRSPVR